jgi:hypothetical protein
MQTSVLGKGLLRPWKCMVVILGIMGQPLIRKSWCVIVEPRMVRANHMAAWNL